ncbi:hypothetical protein GQ53DRAFT_814541 [Thozetella sp. PMI_491]|nr:hypothetical protein GQ53DRAFT_814541 [Thozetella sp. PMI_491]
MAELAASQATPANPACAQASILAQGIALNIVAQQNEVSSVNTIARILQATTVDMQQFTAAKEDLLTFVNTGIAIRQMNQQVTPRGNAATAGLAIVANAQLTELGLATNLTGNPKTDLPNVATLQMDFSGGIQQNMKNQQAALAGCTGAAGTAPPAPANASNAVPGMLRRTSQAFTG